MSAVITIGSWGVLGAIVVVLAASTVRDMLDEQDRRRLVQTHVEQDGLWRTSVDPAPDLFEPTVHEELQARLADWKEAFLADQFAHDLEEIRSLPTAASR